MIQKIDKRSLLTGVRCEDLLKEKGDSAKQIIEIDSLMPIAEGCQVLVKNGISSAPVRDNQLKSYVGMLDFRDLVSFVLEHVNKRHSHLSPLVEGSSAGLVSLCDLVHASHTPARVVTDLSLKNPFYSIMKQSPVAMALVMLSSGDIHRVNVLGDGGDRVAGIISQTDLLRFLIKHEDLYKDILDTKVEVIMQSVKAQVDSSNQVIDALKKMFNQGVTSVAVIGDAGLLMGNISMADVRFIIELADYGRLHWTCSHFVSSALSQVALEHEGKDRFPVWDARPHTTIGSVVKRMLATKAHHMWITDEAMQLIGVVGMTDILSHVASKVLTLQSEFENI